VPPTIRLMAHYRVTMNEKRAERSRAEHYNTLLKIKIVQKHFQVSLESLHDVRGFQFCCPNISSMSRNDLRRRGPESQPGVDGTTKSQLCDERSTVLNGTSAVAVRSLEINSDARSIQTFWGSTNSLYWIRFRIGSVLGMTLNCIHTEWCPGHDVKLHPHFHCHW